MKWETHDEKCLTMFALLLLSLVRNNTDMRIKGSSTITPSVQCPSKVSPTQRVKLLSDKTEAFVQKIESHKRRLPSSTQCRPLRNLGKQNILQSTEYFIRESFFSRLFFSTPLSKSPLLKFFSKTDPSEPFALSWDRCSGVREGGERWQNTSSLTH